MFLFLLVVGFLFIAIGAFMFLANQSGGVFVAGAAVAVILLGWLFCSIVVIEPGRVGVQVRFGKMLEKTLDNGLHWKNPFTAVKKMNAKLQEYTMSGVSNEGEKTGDDSLKVLSREGLTIGVDISVWYYLDSKRAQEVYRTIGSDDKLFRDKIIRPVFRTVVREGAATFRWNELYSEKRTEFASNVFQNCKDILGSKGFIADKIMVRNVTPPKSVKDAIELKMKAEQSIQQKGFEIQEAKKEADRKIAEARGLKEANAIISKGLTHNYIRWYRLEVLKKFAESKNNTILVIPEDLKSVPMIMPGK